MKILSSIDSELQIDRCTVIGLFAALVTVLLLPCSTSSFADSYDVRIQDKYTRGLLHESYMNMLSTNTIITFDLPTLAQNDQLFVYQTPTTGTAGIFDFKREKWIFSGGTLSFNPWYRYNDGVADPSGTYDISVTGEYDLYKTFSFPEDLPVDSTTRKLIVLIHGWNPDELEDPYSSYGWPSIIANLNTVLGSGSDWKVIAYNWAEDAATGPILDFQGGLDFLRNAIRNGTQAAEISHQHGQHLGPLIRQKFTHLEKIHFIAHSAGTWNARALAIYLAQNVDSITIQVTLLDPYIPGEAPDPESDCTIDKVNQLATLDRISLLENYYYANDVFGTESVFSWRDTDRNVKLGSSFLPNPMNHLTPVSWYGSTISKNATNGWAFSMAYNDTVETAPNFVADKTPGRFRVKAPYPNPFNPETTLEFEIPADSHVSLYIYNILGRRVATLIEGELGAGVHRAVWNGRDNSGTFLGSGVYLYSLTVKENSHGSHRLHRTQKGKMMFVR